MLTRSHFRANAKPIRLNIDDLQLNLDPKEFSTGSLGWYANGKITVMLGDIPVRVQVGVNLTVVDSKKIPA